MTFLYTMLHFFPSGLWLVGQITPMHTFTHIQHCYKMRLTYGLLAKGSGTYVGQGLATNSPRDMGEEG